MPDGLPGAQGEAPPRQKGRPSESTCRVPREVHTRGVRLVRYTLNTGKTVLAPRSGISRATIKAFDRLIESGPLPGCDGFRVAVDHGFGSAAIVVSNAQSPIMACGLAWTAIGEQEAWPWISGIYRLISNRVPRQPGPPREPQKPWVLPWLAVIDLDRNDAALFGDFLRCLAWAILEWVAEDGVSPG